MKKINYNYIIILIIIIISFGYLKKILSFLGLIPDTNESENLDQMYGEDYFSPDYHKKIDNPNYLTQSSVNWVCESIYDTKSWYNDDEPKLYGIFESINSKTKISQVAEKFNLIYGRSLLGFIQSFLNDSELANLASICNKKPVN